jgi:hypothetical protein
MAKKFKFRKNNGEWCHYKLRDELTDAISRLTNRDSLEIKIECNHEETWVENGVKICKDCGEQLEVTSFRD